MRTLGIAYDKERLEVGKSTANLGLAGLACHVHEAHLFSEEELVTGQSGSSESDQKSPAEEDSPCSETPRPKGGAS